MYRQQRIRFGVFVLSGCFLLLNMASVTYGASVDVLSGVDGVNRPANEYTPKSLTVTVNDSVRWLPAPTTTFADHPLASANGFWPSLTSGITPFTYTFTQPGTYIYYCTKHGTAAGTGMAGTVTVSPGKAPNAVLTSYIGADAPFGKATFFGNQSTAFNGKTITKYEWDFNNDGITDATGVKADFVYETVGSYPMKLTVTDSAGMSSSISFTFDVAKKPEPSNHVYNVTVNGEPTSGSSNTHPQATIPTTPVAPLPPSMQLYKLKSLQISDLLAGRVATPFTLMFSDAPSVTARLSLRKKLIATGSVKVPASAAQKASIQLKPTRAARKLLRKKRRFTALYELSATLQDGRTIKTDQKVLLKR